MNVSPPETHRYAQRYASRGLAVVPIPVGQKSPVLRSWQRLRIEPEKVADYFNGNALNIGILLGEPSGGVVEVDCDVQEAVAAAPYFLSKTARSGRESSPESHWWYRSQGIRSKKFQDADGAMLLELRSTGCQTLVAPSLHPEGDRYLWAEGTREIVEISPKELGRRCRLLATATLVARHLPPVGGRHDFALALAGFLLRENRLDENEALRVMEAAWSVAEGSTVEAERDLRGIVRDTARNLASGADVVGGRRLEELTPGLPQVLGRWWGRSSHREPQARIWEDTKTVVEKRIAGSGVVFSSAVELMRKEIPPVRWVVPGILPEGVALLAGKPKLGKSWLALGLCVAVAAGGYALGSVPVERGAALYLGLEDNERRLKSRLGKVLSRAEPPTGLDYATFCPRLDEGGLEAVAGWLENYPDARLVVVDTLAKIRPRAADKNIYQEDYQALEALLPLAAEHNAAIVVVHHLRKQSAADPLDEVNSSIGLTGGVDGALILKRDRTRADASLFVTGRDVEEEKDLALRWSPDIGAWTLVGDAEEYRASQERQEILEYVREAGVPVRVKDVATALEKNYKTVAALMQKMLKAGTLSSPAYGKYEAANPELPVEVTAVPRGPTGHTKQNSPVDSLMGSVGTVRTSCKTAHSGVGTGAEAHQQVVDGQEESGSITAPGTGAVQAVHTKEKPTEHYIHELPGG